MTDSKIDEINVGEIETVKDSLKSPPSKRYKKLLQVIDKGLSESKKFVDTHEAVIKCYGEDTSIFAGGGSEESARAMLANLIEGVIDNSNERLQEDIVEIFEKENIPTKLKALDNAIDHQETVLKLKRETDEDDKRTAREALDSTKLPENITISDVLRFHVYKTKKEFKDKLSKELKDLEAQNKIIIDQNEVEKKQLNERISKMEEKEKVLEQVADMCTYVNF